MRSTKSLSWPRRVLGLDAVPGPPHAFGLSETSIRYASFPRLNGGFELREFHEEQLPAGTFGSGVLGPVLQEERSLRAALESLLSRLSAPPEEASLVVPDGWLRIVFTEAGDLPRSAGERDEVLRWKLKRLVPFKVQELRLRALEVAPLPDQADPRRLLLAFAAESLLSHLETAFSACGIRLGRITNVGLSLLETARAAGGRDSELVIVGVDAASYTIVVARAGRPVVYRHKPLAPAMTPAAREDAVRRELRLTRTFIERHVGPASGAPVYLFAGAEEEARWRAWLAAELGGAEVRAGGRLVGSNGRPAGVEATSLAPLMGAACTMVA